jgi:hypothetical protein
VRVASRGVHLLPVVGFLWPEDEVAAAVAVLEELVAGAVVLEDTLVVLGLVPFIYSRLFSNYKHRH